MYNSQCREEPDMYNCTFCKNPLRPWYQWKGSDSRFYRNEFCADASETTAELTASPSEFRNRPAQCAK
jgi:hypothetical protein